MSQVVQRRLRTSVLGAAFISAFVAGLIGASVIVVGSGLGLGAGGLAEVPLAMLVSWGLAMGPFTTLPVGTLCGAAVAQYVRRQLLRSTPVQTASLRAAATGGIFGALYGTGLYYLDRSGPSLALLITAGLIAGMGAGRTAAAVVISDYRADTFSQAG